MNCATDSECRRLHHTLKEQRELIGLLKFGVKAEQQSARVAWGVTIGILLIQLCTLLAWSIL